MIITVIGASGFIGRHLTAALTARGDDVRTASARDPGAAARACAGAQVVVNLAGENVAQRWTPAAKAKIRASRVEATRALLDALAASGSAPQAYVAASATGYYGTSETVTFDESSPPGDDFLAEVCVAWEREADRAASLGMRVAKIRSGIVLGTDGGALAKLLPLFRLGAGGAVAGGRQWYSWIHIDDEVGIFLHAIDGADGVLAGTAPHPVRNDEFTRALGAALHRPALVPVAEFAMKLLLGEAASVVTRGQRVVPTRTLASGYRFRYPDLQTALAELLAGVERVLPRHPAPLTTRRLQLEPLGPAHAPALFAELCEPELYRFIPGDAPATAAALETRYRRMAAGPDAGNERWWNWALFTRESGTPVGTVELTLQCDRQRALLAYMLGRAHWGRGYAFEACVAAFAYLRANTLVRSIEASLDTRNARSAALVERLGFQRLELVLGADHFKGLPSDEYRYALPL